MTVSGNSQGRGGGAAGSAGAIRRSIDIYYRDIERNQRMDRLNACFVSKGGLAFDIGAHVGDRTASFLRLGARAVALEPQPQIFRALRLIHGRTPGVILECQAAGARVAEIEMFVNSGNPTISTLSGDLIAAANLSDDWQDQVWDKTIRVPVTTLDVLIETHGTPDFIKIDVEGHEHEVLLGLTHPVRALSFEFTTIQRDIAFDCIGCLDALGDYEFNISLGEDHRLRQETWVAPSTMRALLASLPTATNSGDIYARRSGGSVSAKRPDP